jgi:DNA invertase Pin-like site-specific DNA recombinase
MVFLNQQYLHQNRRLEKIELFRCGFLMHNETMIYGYARVSIAAQDESGQVKQLKAAGCGKIFRAKITDTAADRPQLTKLMKALPPATDVVMTPAVDRLSRDTTDLLVIAREMQRAGLVSVRWQNRTSIRPRTLPDRLCDPPCRRKLQRRHILERTARGRADAKAKGVKFGRKPILTQHQQKEARNRLEAGETQRSVARSYNVSQSTISRL